MGNTSSTEQSDMVSLASHIDDIAVHYILNQNTIDLLRLTDKEYYDNLIILTPLNNVLTSNIIEINDIYKYNVELYNPTYEKSFIRF